MVYYHFWKEKERGAWAPMCVFLFEYHVSRRSPKTLELVLVLGPSRRWSRGPRDGGRKLSHCAPFCAFWILNHLSQLPILSYKYKIIKMVKYVHMVNNLIWFILRFLFCTISSKWIKGLVRESQFLNLENVFMTLRVGKVVLNRTQKHMSKKRKVWWI